MNVATTAGLTDLKFRLTREDFADAVAWVARNLPSRPTVPVLAGVLLTGSDDGLTVSGFDYEVSAEVQIPAEIASPGSVLVSGRLLSDIVRSLPAKPVDVSVEGTRVSLTCGSARFSLPTMAVEDYPTLPTLPDETGVVSADLFAEAIGQVAVAAGRDDTLPMLTGIRVEISGEKVVLAATDRFRLAVRELTWSTDSRRRGSRGPGSGQDAGGSRQGGHRRYRSAPVSRVGPRRSAKKDCSASAARASAAPPGCWTRSSRSSASCCPPSTRRSPRSVSPN